MHKITIALAEDQQLFRQSLAMMIRTVPDFELVAEAENGKDLLSSISALDAPPNVVLADLNMPECNGVELNEILQAQYPAVKVIILTVYNEDRIISKMIDAGAHGYLVKNCNADELFTAIRSVHKSGFYLDDKTLNAVRKNAHSKSKKLYTVNNIPLDITEREREILLLICKEFTNTEIGAQLFLSSRTVEGYRNNLLIKVGCRNTAGLVLFAVKNGIYDVVLSR